MYQLNSVINHMGETLDAGHYNILFHGKVDNNFILVDDSDIYYNANTTEFNKVSYVVIYDKLWFKVKKYIYSISILFSLNGKLLNKLACASVKLHVWLEFLKVLSDLINFWSWVTNLG